MSEDKGMASSAAQTAVGKALRDVLSRVQKAAEKAGRSKPVSCSFCCLSLA